MEFVLQQHQQQQMCVEYSLGQALLLRCMLVLRVS
jgi:hypothetical protein